MWLAVALNTDWQIMVQRASACTTPSLGLQIARSMLNGAPSRAAHKNFLEHVVDSKSPSCRKSCP